LDLGTTYLGVPLQRHLRLTNTALLPCRFEWSMEPLEAAECSSEQQQGALALRVMPASGWLQPGKQDALAALTLQLGSSWCHLS
jgi:hypothetical protein